MPFVYLVRHAKPSATWGQDADPGLDDAGESQAQATADELSRRLRPAPLLTSPMRRCRETAVPLERTWHSPASLFPAVAEIPAPPLGLAERHEWLVKAMAGTWQELHSSAPMGSPNYLGWRADLLSAIRNISQDCVIFTHFIAINAVVGAARGSDAVVCFRPDHASVTLVETSVHELRVLELGREATTTVLTRA